VLSKIVAYELLSLDGVAEQPDEFITEFDEAMTENLGRVIAAQSAVLLGRRTYNDWAAFWPGKDIQPFANFINSIKKFVVTSTEPVDLWTDTTVVDGDLSDFVIDLKQKTDGDIGVHGSITLAQSLLELGLVDELRLVVAPALQMRGRKLFDKGLSRRLTLTRQVASPSGYLMLDFRLDG
jgi:dihydrofolate reductase